MLQNLFSIRLFQLTKWSFLVHSTTRNAPYKNLRHDSILDLWRTFPYDHKQRSQSGEWTWKEQLLDFFFRKVHSLWVVLCQHIWKDNLGYSSWQKSFIIQSICVSKYIIWDTIGLLRYNNRIKLGDGLSIHYVLSSMAGVRLTLWHLESVKQKKRHNYKRIFLLSDNLQLIMLSFWFL